ncbi:hypothetical protein NP233_g9058 [Leucocoprinus birnbaumii]|uniref:Uncharacterized protein n=1 Tax=Leucocoprinus birnbaumii TaxID=56174 RepID=A0AAD5YMK3_9AGAR|nr:hypothetical protein NP233_g9058 [Leucocoprinus birnbaumii]
MMSYICSQEAGVFQHTRSLNISSWGQSGLSEEQLGDLVRLWNTLLISMQNLASITLGLPSAAVGSTDYMFYRWAMEYSMDTQPDWMNTFVQNIGSHPTLTNFTLVVNGVLPPATFSLQPLSHLHDFSFVWDNTVPIDTGLESEVAALIARCHNLKRLKLQFPYVESPHALAGFFRGLPSLERSLRWQQLLITQGILVRAEDFISNKRHFQFLEDLTLDLTIDVDREHPRHTDEVGKLFSALCAQKIHLKRISLTNLHPSGIVEYISSYSGLTGFPIKSHGDHRDDSPSLIHNLFIALKRHQRSLTSLSFLMNRISPCLEIPKTHISENAESFSALEHLEIEVHTSDEDSQRNDAGSLVGVKLKAECNNG